MTRQVDLLDLISKMDTRLSAVERELASAALTPRCVGSSRVAVNWTTNTTPSNDNNVHSPVAPDGARWALWTLTVEVRCAGAAVAGVNQMIYTNSVGFLSAAAYQTSFPTQTFSAGAGVASFMLPQFLAFPVVAGNTYTLTDRITWTANGNTLQIDGTSGVIFLSV